jgi:hypothetical protein
MPAATGCTSCPPGSCASTTRLAGQLVEQRQARLRPVAHRHRRGPVQRDDRGDGTRPSSTS